MGEIRRVELLVCLLVLIAGVSLISMQQRTGKRVGKVQACQMNLSKIRSAYAGFALDHDGKLPMQISATNGGSLEFTNASQTYLHFRTLSFYLAGRARTGTPQVLICPADVRISPGSFDAVRNESVSYFVNLDARRDVPGSIIAGDRNLAARNNSTNGVIFLSSSTPLFWGPGLHGKQNLGSIATWEFQMLRTQAELANLTAGRTGTVRLLFP